MNREQFLDKVFAMYSKGFNNDNKQEWWNAYKQVLSESIDFDALYQTMILEYDGKSAPSPAWLHSKATYKNQETQDMFISMSKDRRGALVKVATWFNSADYQFNRKSIPFNIRELIKHWDFTSREIDLMMISGCM